MCLWLLLLFSVIVSLPLCVCVSVGMRCSFSFVVCCRNSEYVCREIGKRILFFFCYKQLVLFRIRFTADCVCELVSIDSV